MELPEYHFKRRGAAHKIEYNQAAADRKKSLATHRRRTWVNDSNIKLCPKCNIAFDWFVRKHHCRSCGEVFCHSCSAKTSVVPGCGTKPQRVCDTCYDDLKAPPGQRRGNSGRRRSTHFSGGAEKKAALAFSPCSDIPDCCVCLGLWDWAGAGKGAHGFRAQDSAGVLYVHTECRQVIEPFALYGREVFRVPGRGHAQEAASVSQIEAAADAPSAAPSAPPSPSSPSSSSSSSSPSLLSLVEGLLGSIVVDIESASDVRANAKGSYFGKCGDPYVKLRLCTESGQWEGTQVRTRAVAGGGTDPVWRSAHANRHTLPLPIKPDCSPVLVLEVWNENAFVDDLLGTVRLSLVPVLLNPGMVFRRPHACWDKEDLPPLGFGGSPAAPPEAGAVPACTLTVGVRFDPMQSVYSCVWEAHKFVQRSGTSPLTWVPSLCGICGKPVVGPLPRWSTCTVCGQHVHEKCMALVGARLPCRPRIVGSQALAAHDAKQEAKSIGTLFVHLDVVHVCQPECTALYHVRVHKDDTSAIKSFTRAAGSSSRATTASKRSPGAAGDGQLSRPGRDRNRTDFGASFAAPVSDVSSLSAGRCVYCRILFEGKQVCSPTYLLGGGRDPRVNMQLAYYVGNSRSTLKVEVVDGVSNAVLGESVFSILDIVEQMSTVRFGGAPEEFGLESPGPTNADAEASGIDGSHKNGLQWFALVAAGDGAKPDACSAQALEHAKGFVTMRTYWHQDALRCLDVDPPKITPPPFDVDELKDNVMRLQGIIAWIDFLSDGASRIFSWEDKSFSLTCLVVFLYLSIYFDWSRFLCLPTGFLFLGLCWNYRKRLTGRFNTMWLESVGTPELSTLTLTASIAELSYVPDDEDDDAEDEDNSVNTGAAEGKSAGERAFARAGTLLPANDVCVDTYFVVKQKASDEGIEQLIGRCYPTIRVEVDDDSADDEAGPSATDDTAAGWGFGGVGALLGASSTAANTAGNTKVGRHTGKTHTTEIEQHRTAVAGPGALLVQAEHVSGTADSKQATKKEVATSGKLGESGVASFRFDVIQSLYANAGRELPLPWAENKSALCFRVKLPTAKCTAKMPRSAPDKDGLCTIGYKYMPIATLIEAAGKDAGRAQPPGAAAAAAADDANAGNDTGRHLITLEMPDELDDSLAEVEESDLLQMDISALASLRAQITEGTGKEKELQEALAKQTEALAKAKKEKEAESSLSIFETYRQVKMQAREVQNLVGDIVGQLESLKNIITWAYPPMTMYLLYVSMAATVVTYFLPTSWLLFAGGCYMFADGFAESVGWGKAKDAQSEGGKKKRKKKAAAVTEEEEPMADWEKFVMQVPHDRDLRRAFTIRKEITVANRERRHRLNELQALWQGLLTVVEPSEAKSNRFVVLRRREIVWWKTLAAAESGARPKGRFPFTQILVAYVAADEGMDVSDASDARSREKFIAQSSLRLGGDPKDGKSIAAGAPPSELDFYAQEGPRQRDAVLRALTDVLDGPQVQGAELYPHSVPGELSSRAFLSSRTVKLYYTSKRPKGWRSRHGTVTKAQAAAQSKGAARGTLGTPARALQPPADAATATAVAASAAGSAPPQQVSAPKAAQSPARVRAAARNAPSAPATTTSTKSTPPSNTAGRRATAQPDAVSTTASAGSPDGTQSVKTTTTVNADGKRVIRRVIRRTVRCVNGQSSNQPSETTEVVKTPDGKVKRITRRVIRRKVPASEQRPR